MDPRREILLIAAVAFLIVAALAPLMKEPPRARFEWLGIACFFATMLPF